MEIVEIANLIKNNSGNLYLVGGAIRDELMGRPIYDRDYCVTGISKEKFVELFPNAKIIGKSFEVFEMGNSQFALARKEVKTGVGHKQFEIEVGKDITIQEDLARRDITINSIAKDVLTGTIIDPYNGRKDIEEKVIRATTDAFSEDPLRVYRVARFAAITGFKVEENTLQLMKSLKEELSTLSKERVFIEFKKAIESNKPSLFFDTLKKADVLDVHFKEIYDLIGALQPIEYHPEGDSYNHTMMVLDKSTELTDDVVIRFSCLVHDLGKGITPKEMYPHHYNHDKNGAELVKNLGKRIGVPIKWIECGKVAAREHMRGGIFYKMTPAKKVSFIERVVKTSLGLHGLQVVVIADKCSSRTTETCNISFEKIGEECIHKINGKFLKEKGIKEGKDFKDKLHNERVQWMKKKEFCE